ncbi:SWIM zinc finger family protein [Microlunatus soli]|uniref:SWIM zinc finger n=1 Tax=Microlunatus soli TaxID=630515 RepID=A0A1H1Z6H4_9ACTN|nr:SWIM zinc finger family protein [Microlunatus soli]SDT29324.1 SWIM zinc finger [Microlunatus soli]
MPSWTLRAVQKAAPDAASLTAARRLAGPGPWSDVGSTATLVWGKCQGSGATPYQVSIDSTGPTYRCSCPSRKFPCKHALALMLRFSASEDDDDTAAPSAGDGVPEWARAKAQRAADDADREARAKKPVDAAARARRIADRRALMSAGIEDFARWLTDLVRGGLAEAGRQPLDWWDRTAARLVDAQLPGLAERVRRMSVESERGEAASRLFLEIGRWWLAVRAWRRFDELDEPTRADLRVVLGWHVSTDDVRAGDAITDDWVVLGAYRSEDEGAISQQRTWLRGERSGEIVQILDFGAQGRPLPIARLAGSVLSAELARYPGHSPRRALFAEEPEALNRTAPLRPIGAGPGLTIDGGLAALNAIWQHNPWADRAPVLLHGAVGLRQTGRRRDEQTAGRLTDADGARIDLTDGSPTLLALTGGLPVTIFGELERERFRPLCVETEEGPVPL